jgi:FMN-dependent NADH-azoreductase
VTFRYTETGHAGLLKNKKVCVALTRGGMHRDGANDSQAPHLKTLPGFLGMTNVQFLYAEGMGYGAQGGAARTSRRRSADQHRAGVTTRFAHHHSAWACPPQVR